MKILIAEDDTASRVFLAQLLKQLGHDVEVTTNGKEAWDAFQREHFPILISDWMMPELNGLELCRRIRAESRAKYTYILLLTVVGGSKNYLEAMSAGTDDFIAKPFDPEQLQARLRVAERILGLQTELTHLTLTQHQAIQQERLRALGEMASGIVHDFTNTLSAVVAYSDLLLVRPEVLDDKAKLTRWLEIIRTAGQDAAQIVRGLREFYRHRDEGEVFLAVNVNELVTMALSLTEPRWKAQAQAAGKTVRVETALGEIRPVDGNAAELRDVLTNLIFNAVDAMVDGGTLRIRTGLDDARSSVVLKVSDTGIGMSDEVRRRCLEPFFTTKGERGTGLGLATTYGIIRRHGGSIGIESEPGKGTTFTIHLPVRPERTAASRDTEVGAPSRPLRVLAVDDEPVPLEVVVELLTGDGHAVQTATNGRDALQKFQAGWFDVVVTDMAMPEMSGVDLAFSIKRAAPRKPVIIMLTGFAGTLAERPPDVDLILDKPITRATLREALSIVK